MKLYLMRHGRAQNKNIDPDQGLSDEGRTEVLQLASKLTAHDVHFGQIIHSSKTRARQTAELVRGAISDSTECMESDDIKPNDDPEIILNKIPDWTVDTLIVSHLPFIPGLIQKLCPGNSTIIFETATMACLEKKGMNWEVLWVESP